jgi:2-C-methyl-D-erythritol 4-phosphate cytidylyltransferase
LNSIYGIILSGGIGKRMKYDTPKQFLTLDGDSILRHSIKNFKKWGLFKAIVIVAPEAYIEKTESELSDILDDNDRIVIGGSTRHESTLNGISAFNYENDLIVFHDAARPFVTPKDLDEVTNSALEYGSSTLAEKISETLVNSSLNCVESIINRENAYSIKTPQAIHSSLLKNLLDAKYSIEPTDLCSWTSLIGVKTAIKISNPYNIKITTNDDLQKAELFSKAFSILE